MLARWMPAENGKGKADLPCIAAAPSGKRPGMDAAEYDRMDRMEAGLWWYRALHERLLDRLGGIDGPVLDAGCGTGGLLRVIDRADAHGVERDHAAARRARAKSGRPVACADIAALPFAAGRFAAAVAADVLCHRAVEPAAALAELHRVLRPGGRLVINMPAYAWLLSRHDRQVHNARRQSARQVRDMLERAGFACIDARYWNGLLLPLMIARRKTPFCLETASDVSELPSWLNVSLKSVADLERRMNLRLPFGGSVMATAIRP